MERESERSVRRSNKGEVARRSTWQWRTRGGGLKINRLIRVGSSSQGSERGPMRTFLPFGSRITEEPNLLSPKRDYGCWGGGSKTCGKDAGSVGDKGHNKVRKKAGGQVRYEVHLVGRVGVGLLRGYRSEKKRGGSKSQKPKSKQ